MERIEFAKYIDLKDGLLLAQDAKELSEKYEQFIEQNKELLKDSINSLLKDMLIVYMRLVNDMDMNANDPIIKEHGNTSVHIKMTLPSLVLPKENIDDLIKMYMIAMIDIADACWVGESVTLNVGGEETVTTPFRCVRFTGSSYLLVYSLYDVIKEKENELTLQTEVILMRIPRIMEFYTTVIQTLARGDREKVREAFKNIDTLIGLMYSGGKTFMESLGSGFPGFHDSYFQ